MRYTTQMGKRTNFFTQHNIVVLLLTLDLIILVLHLLFGKSNLLFHLDFEKNIPTYYQSVKLLVFGSAFLFLTIVNVFKSSQKLFVIPLSSFLLLLGLDDLLLIHENIAQRLDSLNLLKMDTILEVTTSINYDSSLWIIYYIPFILIFFAWSFYWFRSFMQEQKLRIILLFSIISLGAVLLCELLSSTHKFSDQTYFFLITIEEFSEMVFASLLIWLLNLKTLPQKQIKQK